MNKLLTAAAAASLVLLAGCQGTGAATPSPTPTPSKSLPLVLTASGFVDYPMKGTDCTQGNDHKKGDPITLTDPSGKVVDSSKLIDAFAAGDKRCQSGFALNAVSPVEGEYTITLGSLTKKYTAQQLMDSLMWKVD